MRVILSENSEKNIFSENHEEIFKLKIYVINSKIASNYFS